MFYLKNFQQLVLEIFAIFFVPVAHPFSNRNLTRIRIIRRSTHILRHFTCQFLIRKFLKPEFSRPAVFFMNTNNDVTWPFLIRGQNFLAFGCLEVNEDSIETFCYIVTYIQVSEANKSVLKKYRGQLVVLKPLVCPLMIVWWTKLSGFEMK